MLLAGLVLRSVLATSVYRMSHNCFGRIPVSVSVPAASVFATEKVPPLGPDHYAAG